MKRAQATLLKYKQGRKNKLSVLCFQDVILDLMNEWEVEMVDIQKATGIPWSTLWDWIVGGKTPHLDGNILELSRYFQCSINYLAFGIGEEPEAPAKSVREFDQAAANKKLKRRQ